MRKISKAFCAIALVVLTVTPSAVAGQQIPNRVTLVMDGLDEAAIACGLTRDILRGAAFSALRYNRIELTEGSALLPFLYINVTTIRMNDGFCVSNYSVGIYKVDTIPDDAGGHIIGNFVYCDKGGVMTGRDMATRMSASIRELVGVCLSDIQAANLSFR